MPLTETRKATLARLEARWSMHGFNELVAEERETIALFWLEGEVMNGGLHQYFYNSSGDLAALALRALCRLGASRSHDLLRSAMETLVPSGDYLNDRELRNDALDALGWEPDHFDRETRGLQQLPEDFFGMALDALGITYERTDWLATHGPFPEPVSSVVGRKKP
jgi:Domain of unknown function (DUF4375)